MDGQHRKFSTWWLFLSMQVRDWINQQFGQQTVISMVFKFRSQNLGSPIWKTNFPLDNDLFPRIFGSEDL